MAHRGRLNVLVNVLGKSPSMLFSEFEGKLEHDALKGSGDVKYHKGFSADLRTTGGNVHAVLAFNPSHLEVVDAGRRGLGARTPGAARRRHGQHDPPAPDPRRRGVRGAGRRHGDAAVLAGAGLHDRRDAARRDQQPGRFHDQRTRRRAIDALLQRRRQDDRGADLPRERRRSRGGGVRRAPRARLPHEIPQGRRHRPRLLPPPRPQRGGRAGGDAADHVPGDPQARDRAPDLRRAAREGRAAWPRARPRR